MICVIHQIELVHRQGTSKKTGKDYDFWACPDKTNGQFCTYTAPGANVQVNPSQPAGKSAGVQEILLAIDGIYTRIDELQKDLLAKIAPR